MSDICPAGCNLQGERVPARNLEFYEGTGIRHYSRAIGVEVPGRYDGVLYWTCPDCGCNWHRWVKRSPYREAAEDFAMATGIQIEEAI